MPTKSGAAVASPSTAGPSYFSTSTDAPGSSAWSHEQERTLTRHSPFDHADASAPTEGSTGFADALAQQLNNVTTGNAAVMSDSPFAISISSPAMPTLTPRKRSPPSNGESPPPSKTSWHGSSSATPYVSRLSLKSDSLPDEVSLKRAAVTKGMKLPPVAGSRNGNALGTGVQSDRFHAILPADLFALLRQENAATSVLILDLRPHSAFSLSDHGRLANSINLCVPSTLLRRPNYKISKVAESVSDADSRDRVRHATSDNERGILKHIVIVDQGSSVLLADSPVHSLLQKYQGDGYQGQLHWVQGGYTALAAAPDYDAFAEKGPLASRDPSPPARESSSSSNDTASSVFSSNASSSLRSASTFSLSSRASTAGTSIMESSDVTGFKNSLRAKSVHARSLPLSAFDGRSTQNYISGISSKSLQQVSGENQKVFSNPFFDSIRQNHEALSHGQSMSNLKPITYAFEDELQRMADQLPDYLRTFALLTPEARSKRVAQEYYQLEAMEQKRMQNVMAWHSNDQTDAADSYNPYSISAGVEKGHLNRYRHIFPFEHARCKLAKFASGESDYVNASSIRFEGLSTTKRYIASQGPVMPACGDFYQLLLQEQVGVVVMLCNLQEGGRDKCCKYYDPGTYGHVEVTRSDALSPLKTSLPTAGGGGGFFTSADSSRDPPSRKTDGDVFTQRTLLLRDLDRPDQKSHKVVHVQYADWPDFDIPPSVDDVLKLTAAVNGLNEQMAKENGATELPPILVHCSAGCGRTGCYMAIDVLVDQLRQDLLKSTPSTSMDVDGGSPPSSPSSSSSGSPGEKDGQTMLDKAATRSTPPLQRQDPLFSMVNEMREQRMSMVANLPQYQFCYEALLTAKLHDLRS